MFSKVIITTKEWIQHESEVNYIFYIHFLNIYQTGLSFPTPKIAALLFCRIPSQAGIVPKGQNGFYLLKTEKMMIMIPRFISQCCKLKKTPLSYF